MIFVDSAFWIALFAERDQHHQKARELVPKLASEILVTTSAVRGETWTWFNSRHGHSTAVKAVSLIARSSRTRIHQIDANLDEAALAWLRDRDERAYSWVDATSFALMRRERIRKVLTFDSDFESAGFEIVRP